MITVFFPSRGRAESLGKTIDSLFVRAERPLDIEVWVAVDGDDGETANAAMTAAKVWAHPDGRYPVNYLQQTVRHGYSRQQKYYNDLLPLTSGEWLFVLGDDAEIRTDHWDSLIRAHAPNVLWPQSNGYPYCFPVVPAAWARALGRFSPSAHPDSYWYSVGKGLDRHVEIPVSVFHDRKDLTGGHDDATYAEGRGRLGPEGMADDGGGELVARDIEVIRRLL